ncbi:hypothetical protein [uncultured Tenacibaculum sp.]|nr:hypothetical protein [uncultured Tenacibaculum sp.]
MKATINRDGKFIITPKNEQEVFLLKCWKEQRGWSRQENNGTANIKIKL